MRAEDCRCLQGLGHRPGHRCRTDVVGNVGFEKIVAQPQAVIFRRNVVRRVIADQDDPGIGLRAETFKCRC